MEYEKKIYFLGDFLSADFCQNLRVNEPAMKKFLKKSVIRGRC